jgi:hypothetical protein
MDMSLREAYLLCKKNRPICFPNLGFWNQLIAYESQLKKENSVKSKTSLLMVFEEFYYLFSGTNSIW